MEPTSPNPPDKPVIAKPLISESSEEKVSVKKKVSTSSSEDQNTNSVLLDVKLNDKPKDVKTPFNFKDNKSTASFVGQKTEGEILTPTQSSGSSGSSTSSSSSSSSSSSKPKETPAEIRAQMLAEEEADGNKQTVDDYADSADMIIDLVDFAVVFFIRAISLDTTDAPYQPSKDRVDKLKKHLTRYLIRQNKSFPMGFLILMAVVGAYGTPLRKAIEHRSMVNREKAKKKKEEGSDSSSGGNPLKKRPGRQPK